MLRPTKEEVEWMRKESFYRAKFWFTEAKRPMTIEILEGILLAAMEAAFLKGIKQ